MLGKRQVAMVLIKQHVPELIVTHCSWFTRFESTVHTTQLAEMQAVLAPTETRWLSLENAVHALRHCFDAVQAVYEEEGSNGDPMACSKTYIFS